MEMKKSNNIHCIVVIIAFVLGQEIFNRQQYRSADGVSQFGRGSHHQTNILQPHGGNTAIEGRAGSKNQLEVIPCSSELIFVARRQY